MWNNYTFFSFFRPLLRAILHSIVFFPVPKLVHCHQRIFSIPSFHTINNLTSQLFENHHRESNNFLPPKISLINLQECRRRGKSFKFNEMIQLKLECRKWFSARVVVREIFLEKVNSPFSIRMSSKFQASFLSFDEKRKTTFESLFI